jgi:hypothetical protein
MNYQNAYSLASQLAMLGESARHGVAEAVAAGKPSRLRCYETQEGFVVEYPARPLALQACWVGKKGQAKLSSLARRLNVRPLDMVMLFSVNH